MNAEFSLRPATEEDSPAIHDLILEGSINPTGLDWRRFTLAVTPEGEVIGCAQLKPHRDGSVELASLAITETWRGRGAARALIEYLIQQHDGTLYLMCQSSLAPLYEKFGFRRLARDEMPTYFRRVSKLVGLAEVLIQRGETLLIMRRA